MKKTIKKVLVTGGAGYIGNALVRKLLERGYQVRVLDCLIFGDGGLKDIKGKIELVKGDIRKLKPDYFKNIDAIIHLAGFSTEPTSQYDPRLTDHINHIATEDLALEARKRKISRFVYASSCSVYFTLQTPLDPPMYKENDPINPISSYSITKRCSEQILLTLANRDFHPIIFRKGTLYGYSPRMRYDLVFNSFAKDAYFKKTLTVDAGGEIWRPMIDIQDVVWAYIKALELPISDVSGKIFNISNENWNIGVLAKFVKEAMKKRNGIDINLDIKPYGLTRNYKVDDSLFKKTFKFRPQRNMHEALNEFWDLYDKKDHDPYINDYYNDKTYIHFFNTSSGVKYKKYA